MSTQGWSSRQLVGLIPRSRGCESHPLRYFTMRLNLAAHHSIPISGQTTPARKGRWNRMGSGATSQANVQARPIHADAVDRLVRLRQPALDRDQEAVKQKVGHREAVPGPNGHADGQLVQQAGAQERRGECELSAGEADDGLVNRNRCHLGEREVPPSAPEFVQVRSIEAGAKQALTIGALPPPSCGKHVEDAEMDDQAEPYQEWRRRQKPRRRDDPNRPRAGRPSPGRPTTAQARRQRAGRRLASTA